MKKSMINKTRVCFNATNYGEHVSAEDNVQPTELLTSFREDTRNSDSKQDSDDCTFVYAAIAVSQQMQYLGYAMECGDHVHQFVHSDGTYELGKYDVHIGDIGMESFMSNAYQNKCWWPVFSEMVHEAISSITQVINKRLNLEGIPRVEKVIYYDKLANNIASSDTVPLSSIEIKIARDAASKQELKVHSIGVPLSDSEFEWVARDLEAGRLIESNTKTETVNAKAVKDNPVQENKQYATAAKAELSSIPCSSGMQSSTDSGLGVSAKEKEKRNSVKSEKPTKVGATTKVEAGQKQVVVQSKVIKDSDVIITKWIKKTDKRKFTELVGSLIPTNKIAARRLFKQDKDYFSLSTSGRTPKAPHKVLSNMEVNSMLVEAISPLVLSRKAEELRKLMKK